MRLGMPGQAGQLEVEPAGKVAQRPNTRFSHGFIEREYLWIFGGVTQAKPAGNVALMKKEDDRAIDRS